MNDIITFRRINEFEWKMINSSLSTISKKIILYLKENKVDLFIRFNKINSMSIYPFIYLVPEELIDILSEIPKTLNILNSGLYFGMLRKGNFSLSLEGAEFLLAHECFTDENKLYVNDKGEKSILYGNHILRKYASKFSPILYKDQFLLILNEFHELIAIAKAKVNFQEIKQLKADDIMALCLIDKGYYMREKQ